MRVIRSVVVGMLLAGLIAAPAADARARRPKLALKVLSDRPDVISAADALVAVRVPKGVNTTKVRVRQALARR